MVLSPRRIELMGSQQKGSVTGVKNRYLPVGNAVALR